jgi:hypothetical protein
VAVDACGTLIFSAFERYGKKLANRALDLRRHNISGRKLEQKMAEAREEARPIFLSELQAGIDLALNIRGGSWNGIDPASEIVYALDACDNGKSPVTVAEALTHKLLTKVKE